MGMFDRLKACGERGIFIAGPENGLGARKYSISIGNGLTDFLFWSIFSRSDVVEHATVNIVTSGSLVYIFRLGLSAQEKFYGQGVFSVSSGGGQGVVSS